MQLVDYFLVVPWALLLVLAFLWLLTMIKFLKTLFKKRAEVYRQMVDESKDQEEYRKNIQRDRVYNLVKDFLDGRQSPNDLCWFYSYGDLMIVQENEVRDQLMFNRDYVQYEKGNPGEVWHRGEGMLNLTSVPFKELKAKYKTLDQASLMKQINPLIFTNYWVMIINNSHNPKPVSLSEAVDKASSAAIPENPIVFSKDVDCGEFRNWKYNDQEFI